MNYDQLWPEGSASEKVLSYYESVKDFKVFNREIYGDDPENRPNEHCFWDSNWDFWKENDQHLRDRIKDYLKLKDKK